MNKLDYKYKKLAPFKLFVLENFPFIEADFDAITNYQLMCKIDEYINEVAKNNDIMIDNVEALNNWFNNLDVQTEINNKLDEMATDGTLEELIAQYVNLSSILAFNTVNDMKNATNLINGSFAKTYGFYSYNDGGSAFYKIRNVNTSDVINNANLIAINENLVAELIINNDMNVLQFGLKNDGNFDNSNILNIVFNLNIKSIYFPKGSYKINNLITLNNTNIKLIHGESQDSTIIIAPNGFIYCENTLAYFTLENLTLNGLSINNNFAIKGKFTFSNFKNLHISNYLTAFNTIEGTWIDLFENILINYCGNGVKHNGENFNNINFINCYFQHITNYCIDVSGYTIKFLQCDFENSKYCFHNLMKLLDIDNCYIEGNEIVFNIDSVFYDTSTNVHDSWLIPNSNNLKSGWLATIYTSNNVDVTTAPLIFKNNFINNVTKDTIKPFAFTNDGNKTYIGISLFSNYYSNIKTNNPYNIYYDDLFDLTNCPNYGTPHNPTAFSSDLALYKYNNIIFIKEDFGNIKGFGASQRKTKMLGYYNVESTGSSIITISPDKKYGNMYPQIDNLPILVLYNDGSTESSVMSVDTSNFYCTVDSSKTTKRIIFDLEYYQDY